VLSGNGIVQSRAAAGSGKNHIGQSVSGNGYNVNNVIDSSGSFSTSSSTAASGNSVGLSQNLAGSGDLSSSLGGNKASDSTYQITEVTNGALSTSQNLAAADGVYAGQNTKLSGESGGIGSSSSSEKNNVDIAGGFSGQGDLVADLSAMASGRSSVGGDASFLGVPVLNERDMQTLDSGDMALSVDGLSVQTSGNIGSFGLSATNQVNGGIGHDTAMLQTQPATTAAGGTTAAYSLTGKKRIQKDPQIKLYLKNDAYLANEGLSATAVKDAITSAANTWDDATNQNLFADSNMVTVTTDSAIIPGKYDKKNVIAFRPYSASCNALASTSSWYQLTKVGGYYPLVESDIIFNTKYNFGTAATAVTSKYDFQSVALHELGHTVGMGDIYGTSKNDGKQIMGYYSGRHTLGNGDATGIWNLYG
jgi:hypothetical protein